MKMKKDIAGYIDHTLLKADAPASSIKRLCAEAKENKFASVCVNPYWVSLCADELEATEVKVCCVIGFPLGATTLSAITSEATQAIRDGAEELDLVMNQGLFKTDEKRCIDELAFFVKFCRAKKKDIVLKLIVECCNLTKKEIVASSLGAKKAGFDFVKTSTGFGKGGATLADVRLMRKTVGPKMGVKAAGGIRDRKTALSMIRAGADRIGCSCSCALV